MEDLWKVCMSSAHNFLSLNSPEAFRLDTPYHIRYSKKLEDVLRPLHPVGLQIDQERIAAAKLGQAGLLRAIRCKALVKFVAPGHRSCLSRAIMDQVY